VRETIKIDQTIEPNADGVEALEENYAVYRSLYPALRNAAGMER
jgi:hypothetical protein